MDTTTIVTIATVLAALHPFRKVVHELLSATTLKMRDEYRFSNEFLSAANKENSLHPFALAKGYQALAGSTRVTVSEIKYILDLEDSPNRLRDFVHGYAYLQHLSISGENEISFRTKFISQWSRQWRKAIYFGGYVILALAALSPLILAKTFHLPLSALILTVPLFGTYCVLSLMA